MLVMHGHAHPRHPPGWHTPTAPPLPAPCAPSSVLQASAQQHAIVQQLALLSALDAAEHSPQQQLEQIGATLEDNRAAWAMVSSAREELQQQVRVCVCVCVCTRVFVCASV